ncbi:DNA annealing helicase and endonuclease ZRANB3 isoform X1 [Anolis carolinensis]|uniref:Zinc finger RANBP2-type containing 3 n=2 Tax=Anolis carolinensis TaxID=28377 RepID=G1KA61_ANOCA|nr:PREDICTED: DNA annealing helicase and endonuclease ZRANB3 isoform X1 [Anolis carolinensis]XP_008110848.1 PREDICTED: DNA annealing helicase and endonuclease ZRANB3 isoform X1 [Anolis carolinensis]XP_008110853.1 PREDICTED: DNA annealing helicase and endonuclease ZRANB3 isoform X1 [Anolis carolinensis]|eukprot:XP_008110843.1 PREDICTED: DNA annealing helicase and endonuclease ZRANB3 isoform X1 [Anolis carolinensis]
MESATQETPGTSGSDFDEKLSYLPERLKKRLLPFQKKGIVFALERGGRCMIADEMGLGKTIQAIAVSYYYKNEWPLLIVLPSSLRYPWVDELEKWIPDLSPEDIIIIQNKTDIWRVSTSKVIVLGYGLLTSDAQTLIDTLYKQEFKVVIVDESHYMKSRNAARSKILLPIVQNAMRAILLTGTPALGRPEELFMQLEAVCPRKFGTWTEYAKKYCNARVRFFGKKRQWDCRGASNLDELHQLLNHVMIRRLKNDVLTQLPPKIRQRIPFDLPKSAASEFNASFEEWEKLMRASDLDSTESDFVQVMGLITRMFKQTAIAKAGAVKDYIKMLLENDNLKFLVFAHHLSMLQACTEAVIENKTRYIRIDGSVASSERINLVNQFQKDPDTRVAILSIQAAGQGLTFTAATHVVFAELYWDPGHIKQAEDRAHRIGQCSSVNIHYLIANGTMDPLMWAMLNRKARVTGTTLNGKKEKLQALEGDREKWNFLNFAEAWTPNESLNEIKNEALFTHFEKEKQHDIRTFLSPKQNMKRKKVACDNSSQALVENGISLDAESLNELDVPCKEAKRARALEPRTPKSSPKEGSKSLFQKPSCSFAKDITEDEFNTPLSHSSKRGCSSEAIWHCSQCTYSNNSLLPYCEMCDSPRRRNTSTVTQNESQISSVSTQSEKESIAQDDTSRNGTEETNYVRQRKNIGPADVPDGMKEEDAAAANNDQPDCFEQEVKEGYLEDSGSFPAYSGLMFCASRNTDRIHIYTKDGEPLNCNFIPLDIKLDNWEDLPECFQQKQNRSLILKFVREWSGLTVMKQKIIRKSGQLFSSPFLAAEEMLSKQQAKLNSTKRYTTKEDITKASVEKAGTIGGSVRMVTKKTTVALNPTISVKEEEKKFTKLSSGKNDSGSILDSIQSDDVEEAHLSKGYLQAVDNEGNPLCLSCQKPAVQVAQSPVSTAWDARFCSHNCQDDFLFRTSQGYLRRKVFEIEHGVCQTCGLKAQELFLCVRDAPKDKRKSLLESSWMSRLPLTQLNEIILNPTEGLFWQVDHIKPVYSGGGQCSLENLQTLCTVCHKERTAKQAKERNQMKRQSIASKYGSDITRFFVKL